MSIEIPVSELQQAADQCVKCAVCLPHCPTYALAPEEAESPRGRITLLQGIVHERLKPTADVHRHLNSCLSCGRCEQVCPAQVPYTRLLDGTRFLMDQSTDNTPPRASAMRRLSAKLLTSHRSLRALAALGRLARSARLHRLFGDTAAGRMIRWSSPAARSPDTTPPTALAGREPDAWLFSGCLADAFEPGLIDDACYAAARLGLTLRPAPAGLCCGALYQHMGDAARSSALTGRNLAAFSGDDRPIAGLLTGCTRGLSDGFGQTADPKGVAARARVQPLFDLLADALRRFEAPGPIAISPRRVHADDPAVARNPAADANEESDRQPHTGAPGKQHQERVGVYAPCSLDRRQLTTLLRVLNHVTRKELVMIDGAHGCCGAAGDHMLDRPDRADRLAQPIVQSIMDLGITRVLTPNLGCAWHLRANLARNNVRAKIEHPIQWLARSLRHASQSAD